MNINHLGIIVDGNGRWAKERGLKRSEGHDAGCKALEKIILYISQKKLANYLSLYVFSTENFNRPEEEVNHLMELFLKWFKKVEKEYQKENIKIIFSGRNEYLKDNIVETIEKLEQNTKDNTGLVVNFCLSYGGRAEIVDATKKLCNKVINKEINIEDINEELFGRNLYHNLPDIDFLIRTSGESRISNFMLWQISYAEFYFPKTYFPDFTPEELDKCYEVYASRDRRFGKVKEENK